MKLIPAILTLILICAPLGFAATFFDESGQGEFVFLERYQNAQPGATAGAGSAHITGAQSLFINPAGLALGQQNPVVDATIEINAFSEKQGLVSFAHPIDSLYLMLSLAYTDNGSIQEVDENRIITGKFHHSGNMVPAITLASTFQKLHWGTTLKLITENLAQTDDSQTALGWGVDAGILYQISPRYLSLSMAVINAGRKERAHIVEGVNGGSLNTLIKTGVAYRIHQMPRLVLLADLEKPLHNYTRIKIGGEYQLNSVLNLRIGSQADTEQIREQFNELRGVNTFDYQGGNWLKFATGFGIKWDQFTLDYAARILTSDLGINHLMSLSLNL
jgi:hypothetical protein